ncbi:hypothetical protein Godav_021824 [Gossypium davidsonii]|uniref:Uncharacterized protein n=1 Tax=Gossypium davidsonii TaxID=34287 RepID=A0A7J8TBT3_GOSDV|nr:hypothetical protein [Gossypium davidsonii]
MVRQFRTFLGEFLDYDTKMVLSSTKRFMRIKVRLDVQLPLKRKKKIVLRQAWTWGEFLFTTGDGGAVKYHIQLGYIVKSPIKTRGVNDELIVERGKIKRRSEIG